MYDAVHQLKGVDIQQSTVSMILSPIFAPLSNNETPVHTHESKFTENSGLVLNGW